MARMKPSKTLPALNSWDDVDLALCEILEHQRAISAVESCMQQEIDDAKLRAKDQSDPHTAKIAELSRQIQDYAEANRSQLAKRKTKPLMFGQIGWRKSTKLTIPKDPGKQADIIRLLTALGWGDCVIHPEPKINRDALRAHPLEDIVKVGVGVSVEDVFWLETSTEEIPAADPPEEV